MLNEIYSLIMYSAVLSNSQEGNRPYKSPPIATLFIDDKVAVREEEFRVIPPTRKVQNNNIRSSRNPFPNSQVQQSYRPVISQKSPGRAYGRTPNSG